MAERPKFKHGFTMPLDSPERRRLHLGITETSDSYSEGETISIYDTPSPEPTEDPGEDENPKLEVSNLD